MQSRPQITLRSRCWDFVLPLLDSAAVMASLAIVHWVGRGYVDEMATAMGMIAILSSWKLTRPRRIATPDRVKQELASESR